MKKQEIIHISKEELHELIVKHILNVPLEEIEYVIYESNGYRIELSPKEVKK